MRHELAVIDVSTARGLEIGPLDNPRVRKGEGTVFYLDHVSTEELREKYKNDHIVGKHLDKIVPVDYVVRDGKSVSAVVGPDAPFDYIIASHVIEHIPDPVGWMADVARILAPDGIVSLVVPDKRYCFDINRSPTETADLIDAYLRKLTRPSFRQIYDFISRSIADRSLDAGAIWAGTADYANLVRQDVADPAVSGLELAAEQWSPPNLSTSIVRYSPRLSFLRIFSELAHLDLIDYEIAHFVYTEVITFEFYVSLRLLDVAMGRDEMRERQVRSVASIGRHENRTPLSNYPTVPVSPRELQMLTLKRKCMTALRETMTHLRLGAGNAGRGNGAWR